MGSKKITEQILRSAIEVYKTLELELQGSANGSGK